MRMLHRSWEGPPGETEGASSLIRAQVLLLPTRHLQPHWGEEATGSRWAAPRDSFPRTPFPIDPPPSLQKDLHPDGSTGGLASHLPAPAFPKVSSLNLPNSEMQVKDVLCQTGCGCQVRCHYAWRFDFCCKEWFPWGRFRGSSWPSGSLHSFPPQTGWLFLVTKASTSKKGGGGGWAPCASLPSR